MYSFSIFGFIMKNTKKKIYIIKISPNLYVLKLFYIYNIKKNKLNVFKKTYKNNL